MDLPIQDHPACGMSAAHLHLASTREAIATITSVRRPRRVKKQRRGVTVARVKPPRRQPRPVKSLTNRHVACRVNSWPGKIRAFIPGSGWVRINKAAVQRILEEAGRQQPAIATFAVRDGVAYMTPVRRSDGN
jgi:hypothetical protein